MPDNRVSPRHLPSTVSPPFRQSLLEATDTLNSRHESSSSHLAFVLHFRILLDRSMATMVFTYLNQSRFRSNSSIFSEKLFEGSRGFVFKHNVSSRFKHSQQSFWLSAYVTSVGIRGYYEIMLSYLRSYIHPLVSFHLQQPH